MLNIAICDDQKVHCKIAYDMIKNMKHPETQRLI